MERPWGGQEEEQEWLASRASERQDGAGMERGRASGVCVCVLCFPLRKQRKKKKRLDGKEEGGN